MSKSQHSLPVDPERFQPARKPPSEPGSGSCTEVVTLYSKSFMRSYWENALIVPETLKRGDPQTTEG